MTASSESTTVPATPVSLGSAGRVVRNRELAQVDVDALGPLAQTAFMHCTFAPDTVLSGDLSGCRFVDCTMPIVADGITARGMQIKGTKRGDGNVDGLQMHHATLERCEFSNLTGRDVDLSRSSITTVVIDQCDLPGLCLNRCVSGDSGLKVTRSNVPELSAIGAGMTIEVVESEAPDAHVCKGKQNDATIRLRVANSNMERLCGEQGLIDFEVIDSNLSGGDYSDATVTGKIQ